MPLNDFPLISRVETGGRSASRAGHEARSNHTSRSIDLEGESDVDRLDEIEIPLPRNQPIVVSGSDASIDVGSTDVVDSNRVGDDVVDADLEGPYHEDEVQSDARMHNQLEEEIPQQAISQLRRGTRQRAQTDRLIHAGRLGDQLGLNLETG